MIRLKHYLILCTSFVLMLCSFPVLAQDEFDIDELFKQARTAAFDDKDYPKAIAISKKALELNSEYDELRIFLGRVYLWAGRPDSARTQFYLVLAMDPKNQDALAGSYDVEYTGGKYANSLKQANAGLNYYPQSDDFALKKAQSLAALGQYEEASKITANYLKKNPESKPALALQQSINENSAYNRVGAGYTYFYFDKRFDDPWHLAFLSYGKQTRKGSAYLILNYANRFSQNGTELELETHPVLSKGFYAYVGGAAALSGDGIFAKYRLGLSLYKTLPYTFEVEGGLRYFQFNSPTTLIVAGLGKYVGNTFIVFRSFLNPSGDANFYTSLNLSARFYLTDDRYDYFGVNIGTGASPDDPLRNMDIQNNLSGYKAGIEYSRNINKRTILSVNGNYAKEYFRDTHGNQFNMGIAIQRKF